MESDRQHNTKIAAGSFTQVSHEFLSQIVKRSSLRIDEVSLLKAVDRWATKRCKEKSKEVNGANKTSELGEELLQNVRFPLMSPNQFSEVVIPSDILSKTEIIDVFKYFTSVPIPDGLRFSGHPREEGHEVSTHEVRRAHDHHFSLLDCVQHPDKTRVLTITLEKPISLCGVRILASSESNPHILKASVSITHKGKNIIVVPDRKIRVERKHGREYEHENWNLWQGQFDVTFNRTVQLHEGTPYTIESTTSLWSVSSLGSPSQQGGWFHDNARTTNPVSNVRSGERRPAEIHHSGEVLALLYETPQLKCKLKLTEKGRKLRKKF